MNSITFDHIGYKINGQDGFLISGEMHYFRVPREDWAERLSLLKQAGGNCVATYVPWLIHEPVEGDIRFSDVPQRDLAGFLREARSAGLSVIVRPGPYCYSELVNAGLPVWLLENYPQIFARDMKGNKIHHFSVSYTHPLFLEKVRRYYHAFAEQIRPFVEDGTIAMVQLDNELMGIHLWFGSMDCNAETFGIGQPQGAWPQYLEEKYSDIAALNAAYGIDATAFSDITPALILDTTGAARARIQRDWTKCYLNSTGDYLETLRSWLVEDGIHATFCHNSGGMDMTAWYETAVNRMRDDFVLGADHYYALNQTWPSVNPGPYYALRVFVSMETMRSMGFPPTVFEIPGGSFSETPPLLPADVMACHMTNLAFGMKGINYYIFTGGPNFGDTGDTCDIYDYCAPVGADGTARATYDEVREFGAFLTENPWLSRADALASVQIGVERDLLRSELQDFADAPVSSAKAREFLVRGVLYGLFCGKYTPKIVNLAGPLDPSLPLIVVTPSMMSEQAQQNIISFAKEGGEVLLAPTIPEFDWDYNPCTLISEALHGVSTKRTEDLSQAFHAFGENVYALTADSVLTGLDENDKIFLFDRRTAKPLGAAFTVGEGNIRAMSASWILQTFDQARMLENVLTEMGAKPTLEFSNRNIWGIVRRTPEGKAIAFAMNLYSGAQSTDMTVYIDGKKQTLGNIELKPMEVRAIKL